MNWRPAGTVFLVLSLLFLAIGPAAADSVKIEKQKLKLSIEYENFVDEAGDEVRTPGLKATYLLNADGSLAKKLYWNLDLQTGLKSNLDTTFAAGDLSKWIWSNRVNLQATVPVGRFYFGGSFYFRNKWLSQVSSGTQFVDIFEGVGFHETHGTVLGGVSLTPVWSLSASAQVSELIYEDYPLSDSRWRGATVQLARKFQDFRLMAFFNARNVDYDRPVVYPTQPVTGPVTQGGPVVFQKDYFREGGAGIEFAHPFYFSAVYSYQVNNSNNPGFSFHNNQVSLLAGTELSRKWSVQAFGIVQRYDFLDQSGYLPYPLLVGENDDNNLAASLVRTLGNASEIELGIQRLSHRSSFVQLNANKTILYAAYNYRF